MIGEYPLDGYSQCQLEWLSWFPTLIWDLAGNHLIFGVLMSRHRKSLVTPRITAFHAQNGFCCYCHKPMCLENYPEFAIRYKISIRQARLFQCTGEHLVPFSEGGDSSRSNITAACLYCNRARHRRSKKMNPEKFHRHVQQRIEQGRWNSSMLAQNYVRNGR